jgi:hypothetical protein
MLMCLIIFTHDKLYCYVAALMNAHVVPTWPARKIPNRTDPSCHGCI